MESVNCNICGSDNQDLITKDDGYDHSLQLVLCKDCGLGYLNPRWSEEEYAQYYKSSYDVKYRSNIKKVQNEVRHFPLVKRLTSADLINEERKTILDIGCGSGDILMSLSNKVGDSKLFGIEPSENAQSILTERKVELISTDVNSDWDKSAEKKFDIIVMRHVLEHFLNPKKVLLKVRNTLSDDGVMYIAVPNNLKPIHNLRRKWFRVVHTYYFNRFTLNNLLVSAGYEVIETGEEDGLSRGEVYVIVRKSNEQKSIETSTEHYKIQKEAFEKRAKFDAQFANRMKDWRRSLMGKILPGRN